LRWHPQDHEARDFGKPFVIQISGVAANSISLAIVPTSE
jgi:hypothetical protein